MSYPQKISYEYDHSLSGPGVSEVGLYYSNINHYPKQYKYLHQFYELFEHNKLNFNHFGALKEVYITTRDNYKKNYSKQQQEEDIYKSEGGGNNAVSVNIHTTKQLVSFLNLFRIIPNKKFLSDKILIDAEIKGDSQEDKDIESMLNNVINHVELAKKLAKYDTSDAFKNQDFYDRYFRALPEYIDRNLINGAADSWIVSFVTFIPNACYWLYGKAVCKYFGYRLDNLNNELLNNSTYTKTIAELEKELANPKTPEISPEIPPKGKDFVQHIEQSKGSGVQQKM